jgi:hypothetical protein
MATVFFAWELGGGLGHVTHIRPLVKALASSRHQTFLALRDLSKAALFDGTGARCLQAPHKLPARSLVETPRTFAHLLGNAGFGHGAELKLLAEAWRHLFDFTKPELIVFDHSPTGLLAARGRAIRRALIGTAFFSPADQYPLIDLRPWMAGDSTRSREDEDRVLQNANQVLSASGQPPLGRIAQLYQNVDENFLTSFAEFDPYGNTLLRDPSSSAALSEPSTDGWRRAAPGRRNAQYWGPMGLAGGKRPEWPAGPGKRVYGYLKPFPALPQLLTLLNEAGYPTLVYGDGLNERLCAKFQSRTLRFERQRLDLAEVARQCDLAILNGTSAATISMLLAGKPILQIPLFLEQVLNARAVSMLGAGLTVPPDRPEQIAAPLSALLQNEQYSEAARAFASRHADFEPEHQVAGMIERIEKLLRQPIARDG